MKLLSTLLVIFLTGCNSMLVPTKDNPGENYALLSVISAKAPMHPAWPYGIWAVDEIRFKSTPRLQTYVATGRRKISYGCPDVITMDRALVVEATFIAGQRYELVCSGQPEAQIRLALSSGG